MSQSVVFDYYYGDESSQFSFYRIPRQLQENLHGRKAAVWPPA